MKKYINLMVMWLLYIVAIVVRTADRTLPGGVIVTWLLLGGAVAYSIQYLYQHERSMIQELELVPSSPQLGGGLVGAMLLILTYRYTGGDLPNVIFLSSAVARLVFNFDARYFAVGGLVSLIIVIHALLIDQSATAEMRSIVLYYLLVLTTLAGLLPDRPRKRESYITRLYHKHIPKDTLKQFKSLIPKRENKKQIGRIKEVIHEAKELLDNKITKMIRVVIASFSTILLLSRFTTEGFDRHRGYTTWIVIAIIGGIYYMKKSNKK